MSLNEVSVFPWLRPASQKVSVSLTVKTIGTIKAVFGSFRKMPYAIRPTPPLGTAASAGNRITFLEFR